MKYVEIQAGSYAYKQFGLSMSQSEIRVTAIRAFIAGAEWMRKEVLNEIAAFREADTHRTFHGLFTALAENVTALGNDNIELPAEKE